jgi:SAM-dependent methyltransferase
MKTSALKQVSYDATVFTAIETIDDAIGIIVTPEAGLTSRHRWAVETPYLISLIDKHLSIRSVVLDYGCGIGRLAKPIIESHGCEVIGVDISPNMRALAESRVDDYRFMTLPPDMLHLLRPEICDLAIAVWTLQHAFGIRLDVDRIAKMLRPGGKLFVVNNVRRVVPTSGGWIDDGVDVRAVLQERYIELEHGQLAGDEVAPEPFRESTFWALYQK